MRVSIISVCAALAMSVPALAQAAPAEQSALYAQFIAQSEDERSYWCGPIMVLAGSEAGMRQRHDDWPSASLKGDEAVRTLIEKTFTTRGSAWMMYSAGTDADRTAAAWAHVQALGSRSADALELALYCKQYVHMLPGKDMNRYNGMMTAAEASWERGVKIPLRVRAIMARAADKGPPR